MTPSELKQELQRRGSHFFDRKTMARDGDTMKNFTVREYCGRYWELSRKVNKPGEDKYWLFDKDNFHFTPTHKTGQVGTVHNSSRRLEHLIPAFIDAAAVLTLNKEQRDTLVDVYRKSKTRYYFESAIADCDLDWLSNTLMGKSPKGCRFGESILIANDFGWWEREDE